MFAKSVIAFAAAAALVHAAPVEKRGAPAGWAYGYLEDYDTYHVRYLALKCYTQKNTQFFQDCCRPMLSTETLADNRASYCVPSQDATNAVVASLAAKANGSSPSTTSAAAASTSSASSDDASVEYCDEEPSTTSSATAQAAAATTQAAVASTTTSAASTTTTAAVVGEQKFAQTTSASTTTTTTTTQAPAPTTTTTTTTKAPQTTQPSSGGGGSNSGGYATYFYQGGNAGACGTVHGDYDMIVAIDKDQWGSSGYGSGSSTCNRWLTVTNTANGKSVTAMVADVCPTCTNSNSLDLSVGAFQAIADLSQGMVPISWSWA